MEPVILIKIIIINDWLAGSSLHTLYQVAAVMKTTLKLGGKSDLKFSCHFTIQVMNFPRPIVKIPIFWNFFESKALYVFTAVVRHTPLP